MSNECWAYPDGCPMCEHRFERCAVRGDLPEDHEVQHMTAVKA